MRWPSHIARSGLFLVILSIGRLPGSSVSAIGETEKAEMPSEQAEAPADDHIVDLRDLYVLHLRAEQRGEPLPPETPGLAIGQALDVVEEFLRTPVDRRAKSELLSDDARHLVKDEHSRQYDTLMYWSSFPRDGWRRQVVDVVGVNDRLAAVFVVYEKPTEGKQPKALIVVPVVRFDEGWRISLWTMTDVHEAFGNMHLYAPFSRALHHRQQELEELIKRSLDTPLDFQGTWTTHFRRSNAYLTFDRDGHVFLLITRDGSASYGVFDYHLSGDEIVIEHRLGAVRLKKEPSRYWEVDGVRYPALVSRDVELWFPDCTGGKLFNFNPVTPGGWPLVRPRGD